MSGVGEKRLLELAREVCTSAQFAAVELKSRGYGLKRSARILGISTQAVQARLDGAARRIAQAQEREAA